MNYKKEIEILLKKLPHKFQVKYALSCAESVFHLVKDEDKPGVRKSLDTTALWLVDKASADEVYASTDSAAYAAYSFVVSTSAYFATYAAYYVACAAADSATSATSAYYAASYAANSDSADSAASAYYAASYAANSDSADSAAKAKGKDSKHYYEELVRMIKDLTELDKLIYDLTDKEFL